MAHCPEDGALMKAVCLHYHACYDCLDCGIHWQYVEGNYDVGEAEKCLVHKGCPICADAVQDTFGPRG